MTEVLMDGVAISARNISKKYNIYKQPIHRLKEYLSLGTRTYHQAFWALKDVSFDVQRGEAVGIIGMNGSGKSTLLQIVCDILRPTSGEVATQGRISALLELGAGFNPEYTGRDNVLINGQIMGLSLNEMEERFEKIAAFADIGDFVAQPVKTYSSGMFVRLAFASAINVDPDILLIDEALAVGDAYFQQKCIRKLRQFQDEGKTLLFVSHDPSVVKTLCQRAILLDEGRLLKTGSPDRVLDFYQGLLLKKAHRGEKAIVISGGDGAPGSEEIEREGGANKEEREDGEGKPEARLGQGYRIGTDEAFVEEIKLLDKADHEIESIVSEELLKVKVTVRFLKDLEDPHIGFILRNRLGVPVFGTNTFTAKHRLTSVRRGEALTVFFAFRCILAEGDYNISIGIANRGFNVGEFEEYIFLEHKLKIIKVIKNSNSIEYEGMVNLFPTIDYLKSDAHGSLSVFNLYENQDILRNEKYKKYIFRGNHSRPIMLICETVNICNHDCIICAYGRMTRKKETMSLPLFEKVLRDYSDMGGGVLSLTPVVGDIFCDQLLVDRIRLIKKYPDIKEVSFTTNAVSSDRLEADALKFILENVNRTHISVYGMDEEEYSLMTGRDSYHRFLRSMRTMLGLVDPHKVRLGFRFLKRHTDTDIQEWIHENFNVELPFGFTNEYANWGNTVNTDHPLPLCGGWKEVKENVTPCLIPLVACQVFSNGGVSFCHCCDYDAIDEFFLGSIEEKSLATLFNGSKNERLWNNREGGQLPFYCRYCTFHISLSHLGNFEYIFQNPLDFIGG